MKTFYLLFIIFFFLSCSPIFNSVEDPSSTFKSDYDIRLWIKNNIKYKHDFENITLDKWQSPKETIFLGTGDCEDTAILWMYFVKRDFNIDTKLILGLHLNTIKNHYWAMSTDEKLIYNRGDTSNFSFTKEYSYTNVMKMIEN